MCVRSRRQNGDRKKVQAGGNQGQRHPTRASARTDSDMHAYACSSSSSSSSLLAQLLLQYLSPGPVGSVCSSIFVIAAKNSPAKKGNWTGLEWQQALFSVGGHWKGVVYVDEDCDVAFGFHVNVTWERWHRLLALVDSVESRRVHWDQPVLEDYPDALSSNTRRCHLQRAWRTPSRLRMAFKSCALSSRLAKCKRLVGPFFVIHIPCPRKCVRRTFSTLFESAGGPTRKSMDKICQLQQALAKDHMLFDAGLDHKQAGYLNIKANLLAAKDDTCSLNDGSYIIINTKNCWK